MHTVYNIDLQVQGGLSDLPGGASALRGSVRPQTESESSMFQGLQEGLALKIQAFRPLSAPKKLCSSLF